MAGANSSGPSSSGNGSSHGDVESTINIRTGLGGDYGGIAISPAARLRLARQILFHVYLFCLLAVGAFLIAPESKAAAAIFEFVKIGVLPLVTLVIGFYFPNSTK